MSPFLILLIAIVVLLTAILLLRMHAFLALLLASVVVMTLSDQSAVIAWLTAQGQDPATAAELAYEPLGLRLARAFGNTAGRLGLLIAFAAIVGNCLLHSGAAERIVRSVLAIVGPRYAPAGLCGSAFTLGIPAFSDTVLYLMLPLARAMAAKTKRDYLLYVLVIAAAATTAHGLVPPTPGPLFAAAALGVDLGVMILVGGTVGAIVVSVGFAIAVWMNKRRAVPLRSIAQGDEKSMRQYSDFDDAALPPLPIALLPIVLPVLLIATGTIYQALSGPEMTASLPALELVRAISDPTLAMGMASLVSLALLAWQQRGVGASFRKATADALHSAGVIVLVTAAGGAFGVALQQSGIGADIETLASGAFFGLLPLTFLIAVAVNTTTGSGTVAIITTAGVVSGIAAEASLPYHPVYLALAMGSGAKIFMWLNNSFFWVLSRMAGLTVAEVLSTFSLLNAAMGLAGIAIVSLAAILVPLT